MRYPKDRLLIFAKAPEPGGVKTRLARVLGAVGAASLSRGLLIDTLERFAGASLAPIELWCWPNRAHPLFRALEQRFGVSRHTQVGTDLGERMGLAARSALARGASGVLLLGTDCPALEPSHLHAALGALATHDAVLGPVEDGGYALLGLKRDEPLLFEAIPWGGAGVAALTRLRLQRLGWSWWELPLLWDLDRPEDLARITALPRRGLYRALGLPLENQLQHGLAAEIGEDQDQVAAQGPNQGGAAPPTVSNPAQEQGAEQ